jgi:hypothetical protein
MIGADVKATAARYEKYKGGSYLCGEQICESEHQRMTAAPKCVAQRKWLLGDCEAPTWSIGREGQCPEGRNGRKHLGSSRGRGPDAWRKNGRDNVGKGLYAAGAGSNLQRLFAGGITKGEKRIKVWRMSSYERRRNGNAFREDARHLPDRGNAAIGRRDSGHLAVPGWLSDSEPRLADPRSGNELASKPACVGRMCASALVSLLLGRLVKESQGQNRTGENPPSGIVGRLVETCVPRKTDSVAHWRNRWQTPVSYSAKRAALLSRPRFPGRLASLLLI